MLMTHMGGTEPDPTAVATIVERANGNPFYLEELVREIIERGGSTSDLPTSLESLILGRIDRLSPSEQLTARVASVIGRRFSTTWLTEAYGDSLERARKDLSGDITGELVMYSLQKDFYFPYYGSRDISKDMLMRSAMLNKRALLTRIKGESARVNRDIETLRAKGRELESRQTLLARQSTAARKQVKSKQGELEYAREQQAKLTRELETLQNAALGLNRLVKKLQKQAPYRSDEGSDALPLFGGSLAWPADGKVISRFGREEVPALKTWIVREGIRISVPEGAPVKAALTGKVIYAGPFRTYGNVVIVDHEKGFFTVYGLLSRIDASKGQAVETGTQLGLAGDDTQAMSTGKKAPGSAVYFEIRKGDRAIDPLKWLPN